jgi:hypothetical protein
MADGRVTLLQSALNRPNHHSFNEITLQERIGKYDWQRCNNHRCELNRL